MTDTDDVRLYVGADAPMVLRNAAGRGMGGGGGGPGGMPMMDPRGGHPGRGPPPGMGGRGMGGPPDRWQHAPMPGGGGMAGVLAAVG